MVFLPAVCWARTPSSCSPSDDVSVKFTDNCGSAVLQQITPALMSLTQPIWATVNVAMSISLFCSTPMGIYNLLTCMLNSLFNVLNLLSHLKSYKAPPTTAGDTVWEMPPEQQAYQWRTSGTRPLFPSEASVPTWYLGLSFKQQDVDNRYLHFSHLHHPTFRFRSIINKRLLYISRVYDLQLKTGLSHLISIF